jgi:TolB-like protein/cytochrome c-type biogenesis protein CcmH/NrfG
MAELLDRLSDGLSGRYRLDRELGRGGTATVFLAEDLKHRRQVAIKVLRPEIGAAVGADRFLKEIEIAARLAHPNILPLHDSGSTDGLLYYVMPFVEGESLRERLQREGPLPVGDAIRIAREVGDALDHAHAHGLVHRDIKPENILLQAGHAVVSDFGIARAISQAGGTRLTETGFVVGTVAYMSPEQASGVSDLDARSDVYSLGCVVFEMLTGKTPYAGSSAPAVLAHKVVDDVPAVSWLRPAVPATLDEVMRRALVAEPAQRYASAQALTTALDQAATTSALEAHVRRRRIRRARLWVTIAAGLAAVAYGGWWISSTHATRLRRLAVLPVENLTNDPGQDYLAQGIQEELIQGLTQAGAVTLGRTSVARYRNTDERPRDIARDLEAGALVESSLLFHSGDSVGINVRLIDGSSEATLWSQSFDRPIRDVVSIYQEVTRAVAKQIRLAMSPEENARLGTARPVDPQVYEAILQGWFLFQKLDREDVDNALHYFQLALERDPKSAAAYAGIALVWAVRVQNGYASHAEAMPRAEAAARKAIALDDSDARVHFMLASLRVWQEWDWEAGGAEFGRTLQLDPNDAVTRAYYSWYLYYMGLPEDAMDQIRRARELDPLNPLIRGLYAMDLMYAHRYRDAVDVCEETLRQWPDDDMTHSTLRSAYHMVGRYDDALRIWRESYAARGDTAALAALQRGYASGGYRGALRAAAETLDAESKTRFVTPWQIGTLYTRAGDEERALDYLEKAYEAHDPNMPSLAVDPIFDFMRADPRFQAILRKLGLPAPSTPRSTVRSG